ncbi:hypothetical protein X801_01847 [Opisthorchis viverrini]|uniref:Peptidase M60 domain-containing protein n=1 Tax=Opisthorchis viverrini TaxID=6198 RepID=A0A1S8X6G5_OPIVI|nr:hypothetical protein X801_01847 [Opisthorchis viverrini]
MFAKNATSSLGCLKEAFHSIAAVNVALKKPLIGSGKYLWKATDGKLDSTFSPYSVDFPYYYVDLGAVYNLTSIHLYGQNEWSFDMQGINVRFDVHTFGNYMSPCNFQSHYPWDLLASNLIFKRKGEKIELKPQKPVQYILIGRPNPNYPKSGRSIPIGDIQAFGEELYKQPVPQVPTDESPIPPNYHKVTRRAVLGTVKKIWMNPGSGYFKQNKKYNDVVLGWLDQPNSMAVVRGKARMVFVMGVALPKEIDNHPLYENMKGPCKDWLTNGSTTGKYVRVNEAYSAGDVLLITSDDQFDVDVIYAKLESGENSALIGYYAKDDNDILAELMVKLEVDFVKTNMDLSPQFISVSGSADSNGFIPTSYMIERYVQSWTAFKTERFQVNENELGVEDEATEEQVKALVDKYGTLMEYLSPCDLKAYVKSSSTSMALVNYNSILKCQSGKNGFALPNIHRHPGTIPPTTKPTTVVATVVGDVNGNFIPLGVYAKPGEQFTWTLLENVNPDPKWQRLRVNAQGDSIESHSEWWRWPSIVTQLRLRKNGRYVSPHGGPILLQTTKGTNVTIRLENVYRYPWLDLRNNESIASFAREINEYSTVPWLFIAGDSMYSMLKTIDVVNSNANEVTSSARHFDNAIKVMHNYRGTKWEDARVEVFVADIQISAGYGHSGYPWMGSIDWSHLFTLWSSSIKNGGQPGFVHEIGHNLQVGEATLKWGGEVTNNIYRLIVDEINLGLNPYQGDMDTGKWTGTSYEGPGWGYYRYLGRLFGHGLVGNGFIEARKARPGSEQDKTDFWVKQMCKETSYNLLPFHEMWHFPLSQKTREICSEFPCFFPDDEYTKPHQARIDEVLKDYPNCSRTNPNKVVFRGDIRRGIGVVRPQNIFLKFE